MTQKEQQIYNHAKCLAQDICMELDEINKILTTQETYTVLAYATAMVVGGQNIDDAVSEVDHFADNLKTVMRTFKRTNQN